MDRDQLDYGRSLGENWKAQMLTNLVKLRYVDMPVFVDVGQIVSGYSLETMVNAGLGFNTSFVGGDAQSLGASGKYTDRLTGGSFISSHAQTIFSLRSFNQLAMSKSPV